MSADSVVTAFSATPGASSLLFQEKRLCHGIFMLRVLKYKNKIWKVCILCLFLFLKARIEKSVLSGVSALGQDIYYLYFVFLLFADFYFQFG